MSKSKNIEMITGDPKKAIVKLALPMMLSMLLIMLYNIADSIWVAGLGPDALAAVGFITPLFMVLIGLGNGIGAGANSLIARNIGAKNRDQANNAGLHAIVLSIIVSCRKYYSICNGLQLYHIRILVHLCVFRCCISNIPV